MLCVELVNDSVTVMVVVAKIVAVEYEYCSKVLVGTMCLVGSMARPAASARRHTVVSPRTSCRFIRRAHSVQTYSDYDARIKRTQVALL